MMRRNAILINTARGGLVDEGALAQALQDGIIGGAGFDVLTNEPPTAGNVLLDLDLPNFIVTPHIAWASQEAMQILADQLIDNVEAFVAGEPATLCKLERSNSRPTESIVLWRDNESCPRSIAPLRKDYVPLPWMALALSLVAVPHT